MACGVCLQGTRFHVQQWASNTVTNARRIALVTANTVLELEGAAKLCKFASVSFEILKEWNPITFGTEGVVNLISFFKDIGKVGEVFDLNKRWRTWLSEGTPTRWINFISLVCVTAYRALGVLIKAAQLKLFEMANLLACIGNIPVLGYVVKTVPLWFVSVFGLCFDTWANVNETRDQETVVAGGNPAHFDLKKKHISTQIKIYGTIAKMIEIQKNILARGDISIALGTQYAQSVDAEYEFHRKWLNNLVLRRANAGAAIDPTVPAPTQIEQVTFNAIYAQKGERYTLKNGIQYGFQRPVAGGVPGAVDRRNSLDLFAVTTAAQWTGIFADHARSPHARNVLRLEGEKWSILANNAHVTKKKPYVAIAANIAKISLILFLEIGKGAVIALPVVVAAAVSTALASVPFMLAFALVVAGTGAYKVWVAKTERSELQLAPAQGTDLTNGLTALLP